jgi:hypothetical protein
MKRFLFVPMGAAYKGTYYEGVLAEQKGRVVAVCTEEEFTYPEADHVADFVSDCLYWKMGKGDKPKHVIAVQDVNVHRLVSLLTKMMDEEG